MSHLRLVLRLVGVLAPALGLAAGAVVHLERAFDPKPDGATAGMSAPGRPSLVVVAVFDQVPAALLSRYAPLFGDRGFERVKREGVWFSRAELPHAATSTGPGHANIATGLSPGRHGIVENEWYDRRAGAKVYCASTERGPGPGRLLAPTVADGVVAAGGKVVSISIKDRSAIFMGGQRPTACYWFDPASRAFVTAEQYRDATHDWAGAWNRARVVDRYADRTWDRLRPRELYDRHAGPDGSAGEAETLSRSSFPYRLPGVDSGKLGAAVESTPFANEMLLDFAKAAIAGERLGRGPVADLLMVSFSATDKVGHSHGPDSHEAADALARADALLGELLDNLDASVGDGKWALVAVSDHGVCPLPEVGKHPGAVRFHPGEITDGLQRILDERFGRAGGWVERADFPWVHLNRRLAEAEGVALADLEACAAGWLRDKHGLVEAAYTRTELLGPVPVSVGGDPIREAVRRAFHPERSGDVYVHHRAGCLPLGGGSVGTTHGSAHPYDRAVPVLAIGRGVPALGERPEPCDALIATPWANHLLGLPAMVGVAELPAGLVGSAKP